MSLRKYGKILLIIAMIFIGINIIAINIIAIAEPNPSDLEIGTARLANSPWKYVAFGKDEVQNPSQNADEYPNQYSTTSTLDEKGFTHINVGPAKQILIDPETNQPTNNETIGVLSYYNFYGAVTVNYDSDLIECVSVEENPEAGMWNWWLGSWIPYLPGGTGSVAYFYDNYQEGYGSEWAEYWKTYAPNGSPGAIAIIDNAGGKIHMYTSGVTSADFKPLRLGFRIKTDENGNPVTTGDVVTNISVSHNAAYSFNWLPENLSDPTNDTYEITIKQPAPPRNIWFENLDGTEREEITVFDPAPRFTAFHIDPNNSDLRIHGSLSDVLDGKDSNGASFLETEIKVTFIDFDNRTGEPYERIESRYNDGAAFDITFPIRRLNNIPQGGIATLQSKASNGNNGTNNGGTNNDGTGNNGGANNDGINDDEGWHGDNPDRMGDRILWVDGFPWKVEVIARNYLDNETVKTFNVTNVTDTTVTHDYIEAYSVNGDEVVPEAFKFVIKVNLTDVDPEINEEYVNLGTTEEDGYVESNYVYWNDGEIHQTNVVKVTREPGTNIFKSDELVGVDMTSGIVADFNATTSYKFVDIRFVLGTEYIFPETTNQSSMRLNSFETNESALEQQIKFRKVIYSLGSLQLTPTLVRKDEAIAYSINKFKDIKDKITSIRFLHKYTNYSGPVISQNNGSFNYTFPQDAPGGQYVVEYTINNKKHISKYPLYVVENDISVEILDFDNRAVGVNETKNIRCRINGLPFGARINIVIEDTKDPNPNVATIPAFYTLRPFNNNRFAGNTFFRYASFSQKQQNGGELIVPLSIVGRTNTDNDQMQLICNVSGQNIITNPGFTVSDPISVVFENTTREKDRVVSAKDDALGLPGGEKKLKIKVTPATRTLTLVIEKINGSKGSAVFKSTNSNTREITGEEEITILGRDCSDVKRNLKIQAKFGNQLIDKWDFTVFKIDPEFYINGKMVNSLPDTVKNHNNEKLRNRIRSGFGNPNMNSIKLGHNHFNELGAIGAIVIRGKIVPSGMDRDDFNLKHTRTESFNWDRKMSGIEYDKNDCIQQNEDPFFAATQDVTDDLSDGDEDLTPDSDGVVNELFIWVEDIPSATRAEIPNDGDKQRVRRNFIEQAQYGGIAVSPKVYWSWIASHENPAGAAKSFRENNEHNGDNQVIASLTRANGESNLTPDLKNSTIPQFTVTSSEPDNAKQGENNVAGKVEGVNLDKGTPCQHIIYIIREAFTATGGERKIYKMTIADIKANEITGTYSIANDALLGEYEVKVFIEAKAATAPDTVEIKAP